MFQDEVHFKGQASIGRSWFRKGSAPKVMPNPGNKSIAYSGFLISETGELIVNKPGWFNYESVIQSIREFLQARPVSQG